MANCQYLKIKKMFAVAGQLGIGENGLRDVVEQATGQRSISALCDYDANQVLDKLDKLAAPGGCAIRGGMINPALRGKMFKLMYLLGWNVYQLRGFIKRQTHDRIDHEKKLTMKDAYSVVEGLKKLVEKQEATNA